MSGPQTIGFPIQKPPGAVSGAVGAVSAIGQRAGASLKSSLETWPMGWTWMDNFTKPPMEPLSFQHFPTKFGCFSTIHVTSCSKWCWQEVLVLRASELSPLKKLIVVDMLGFSAEPSDQVDVEKARIRSTQELNCNGKVGENSNNHFCIRPIGNWLQLQSDCALGSILGRSDTTNELFKSWCLGLILHSFWWPMEPEVTSFFFISFFGTSTYFNYIFLGVNDFEPLPNRNRWKSRPQQVGQF